MKSKNKNTTTEQVSFRLKKSIAKQLRKIAEYEKRPLSNLLNFILEGWIEKRDLKFNKTWMKRPDR